MAEKNKSLPLFLLSQRDYSKKFGITEKSVKKKLENGELYCFKTPTANYIPEFMGDSSELKEAKNEINNDCIVIGIGNHKGGVLKTTNVQNISASLAFMGYKVLLVDTDPQANATKGFGVFHEHYDLIKNNVIQLLLDVESDLNDEDYENKVKKSIISLDKQIIKGKERKYINGSLDILPNDPIMISKLKDLDNITNAENSLDDLLELIKRDYDFIIIDTPPRTDTILKTALMACDYFIISLKPEPYSSLGVPDILKPIKDIRRAYKSKKKKELFIAGAIMADLGTSSVQRIIADKSKEDIEILTNNTASTYDTVIPHLEVMGESQMGDGAMIYTNFKHQSVGIYLKLTNEIIEKILTIEAKNLVNGE